MEIFQKRVVIVIYSTAVCFRKFWCQLPEEPVPSGSRRVEKKWMWKSKTGNKGM